MSMLTLAAHLRYLVNRHVEERRTDDLERILRADLRDAARLPFEQASLGLVSCMRARLDYLAGRRERAIEHLSRTVEILERTGEVSEAARERLALAVLIGGSEAARTAAESQRQLREFGVVDPLAELLAHYPELEKPARALLATRALPATT